MKGEKTNSGGKNTLEEEGEENEDKVGKEEEEE